MTTDLAFPTSLPEFQRLFPADRLTVTRGA